MIKRDRGSETGNLWYFIGRDRGFVAIFPSDDRVVGGTGRGSAPVSPPGAYPARGDLVPPPGV
jgi:hypothetical protein